MQSGDLSKKTVYETRADAHSLHVVKTSVFALV